MKALAFREHGGIEKLQIMDLPKPQVGPDDVLIRVKAVALNHLDLWVRNGMPSLKLPLPHIPGSDIAGIVEQVGPNVRGVAVGQHVTVNPGLACGHCDYCLGGEQSLCPEFKILGEHVTGGAAEFAAVPAVNVLAIPDNYPFEQAAAAPLVFLTAWRALISRARVREGEDVLILGAGGGVASAGIQIAKKAGARVFATSSSQDKLEKASALGADVLINYKTHEWDREIWKYTNKRGVDVILDSIGEATWSKSVRSLAKGGRLVTIGATSGPNPTEEIRQIFWKQIEIIGSTMSNQREFREVMALVISGQFKPPLDVVWPLERAQEAHARLEKGEQFGKIVLTL